MKKILVTIAVMGFLSLIPTITNANVISQPAEGSYSPQVCQFSLSRYGGTTNILGVTETFTVGLSCPQNEDTYCTVVAFINDEYAGSTVVKVPANQTRSGSESIDLGRENGQKKYKLIVE